MLVFLVDLSCWFFLLSSCASALVVWRVDVSVRLLFLVVLRSCGFDDLLVLTSGSVVGQRCLWGGVTEWPDLSVLFLGVLASILVVS